MLLISFIKLSRNCNCSFHFKFFIYFIYWLSGNSIWANYKLLFVSNKEHAGFLWSWFSGSWIFCGFVACFIYTYVSLFQVFLCFGNSVASTRFLLQDEFNIQTTQCDNCIIVLSPSLYLLYTCIHRQIRMQMFYFLIDILLITCNSFV